MTVNNYQVLTKLIFSSTKDSQKLENDLEPKFKQKLCPTTIILGILGNFLSVHQISI